MMPWLNNCVAGNGEKVSTNFLNWFAGSRVVDDKGQPLLLYHGTNASFDVFDSGRQGEGTGTNAKGFFFSDERAVAEQLADYTAEEEGVARVLDVYLSLKNPLVIDYEGVPGSIVHAIRKAKRLGHDGAILLNHQDGMPSWPANQYIAFRPEQIKSASENCGLYRFDDPSMVDGTPDLELDRIIRARQALEVEPHRKKRVQP